MGHPPFGSFNAASVTNVLGFIVVLAAMAGEELLPARQCPKVRTWSQPYPVDSAEVEMSVVGEALTFGHAFLIHPLRSIETSHMVAQFPRRNELR